MVLYQVEDDAGSSDKGRLFSKGATVMPGCACKEIIRRGTPEFFMFSPVCQNGRRASDKGLLSMSLDEYLKLLDLVGRQARTDKRSAIPAELAPILQRLAVHSGQLVESVEKLTQRFRRMIGPAEQMAARAAEAGRQWFQGKRQAERTFSESGPEAG